jgi:glucosylceramidase
VAFHNPSDGTIALVMVNSHTDARRVAVSEGQSRFEYELPAQSVATFVWNPDPARAWMHRVLRWLDTRPANR